MAELGGPALTESELARVAVRMGEAGDPPVAPLRARSIAGGRSNVTLRLTDGACDWVLRTPPRTGRTTGAHDVGREHRVTSALAAYGFPVPRPVLLCEDESVLGAPFLVAGFVDGTAVQTRTQLDQIDDATLGEVVEVIVSTLATLHRIEPDAVGLGAFGRPSGYAVRQLAVWARQWESVGIPGLAGLEREVAGLLRDRVPEQTRTSIVHGDYRIDNTLLDVGVGVRRDAPVRLLAVVDWELSTLGDPVADVALMCAYRFPALDLIVGQESAWTSDRLPPAERLAERYAAHDGARLEHWEVHLALAHYKVAVIAAGIEHRRRAGSGSGLGFDTAAGAVEPYLDRAREVLG